MSMQQYANKGWLIEAQRSLLGKRTQAGLRAAYAASLVDKPGWITSTTLARLRESYDKRMRDLNKSPFHPEI